MADVPIRDVVADPDTPMDPLVSARSGVLKWIGSASLPCLGSASGIVAPAVKPKAVITRYTPARKAVPPGAIRLEKGLSSRAGGRSV